MARSQGYVSLSPNAGYDPDRDFAPIIQAATQPNVIEVNSGFPAKTLAELLEMAKTTMLAYASPNGHHKAIAKVDLVHIPYQGAGPATLAVVAGEPAICSLAVTAPLPFIRSGRLRALAISSATRHRLLPDGQTAKPMTLS